MQITREKIETEVKVLKSEDGHMILYVNPDNDPDGSKYEKACSEIRSYEQTARCVIDSAVKGIKKYSVLMDSWQALGIVADTTNYAEEEVYVCEITSEQEFRDLLMWMRFHSDGIFTRVAKDVERLTDVNGKWCNTILKMYDIGELSPAAYVGKTVIVSLPDDSCCGSTFYGTFDDVKHCREMSLKILNEWLKESGMKAIK